MTPVRAGSTCFGFELLTHLVTINIMPGVGPDPPIRRRDPRNGLALAATVVGLRSRIWQAEALDTRAPALTWSQLNRALADHRFMPIRLRTGGKATCLK